MENNTHIPGLEALIEDSGLREGIIAKKLGFSYFTWRRRRLNPAEIQVSEIIALAAIFRMTPEEMFSIILREIELNKLKTEE